MKHLLLILIFIFFGRFIAFSQFGCIIDTIYYKVYEVNTIYNDERYTDVNLMMTNQNLKHDWIIIYKNNKIHKRILGNTLGGSNRIEKYYYNEDGRLKSIIDYGTVKSLYDFYYDSIGLLSRIENRRYYITDKEYHDFGIDEAFFEFKDGNVIKRTNNPETGNLDEYVEKLEDARKFGFKYGNIDFLDATFGLAGSRYEKYGYTEEFQYDHCNNMVLYVVRNPDNNNNILSIKSEKYVYKY
ncbi:MAG: hypothetical protein LC107_04690 [Chitinophagales bacterium]|nr:hypothetical protein [Chitinophagales bacterium]